jgi:hypothetical protein
MDGIHMRRKATMNTKQGVIDNSGQGKAIERLNSGLIKGVGVLSATYTQQDVRSSHCFWDMECTF